MANTFLTPDIIAKEALMVLRNNAVMPNLVYRDYESEFVAGRGDTITIRKPATFTANDFDGTITVQNASESSVSLVLNKWPDCSFEVTSKELTLDIADFSQQLLVPAMQTIIDHIDNSILALGATATEVDGTANVRADIVNARKILTANAAPLTERNLVYGSDFEASMLMDDMFITADKVGDEGTALREASLGRKFGLDMYVDQNIDGMDDPLSLAFHKNAIALAVRSLALPEGAAKAAVATYDGLSLRVVQGYDMTSKKETISIDVLYGVKLLDAKLIAAITPS